MAECGVCYEAFTSAGDRMPLSLPSCGHSICRGCAISIKVVDGAKQCPTCRVDFPIAVVELRPTYAIISMLENSNVARGDVSSESVLGEGREASSSSSSSSSSAAAMMAALEAKRQEITEREAAVKREEERVAKLAAAAGGAIDAAAIAAVVAGTTPFRYRFPVVKGHIRAPAGVAKAIYLAVERNDLTSLSSLCFEWSGNPVVDEFRNENWASYTALMHASACGFEECLRVLVAAGANIEERDPFGFNPLHISAYNGRRGNCRALLDAGASISATDDVGRSHLAVCIEYKYNDWQGCVTVLESAGAK